MKTYRDSPRYATELIDIKNWGTSFNAEQRAKKKSNTKTAQEFIDSVRL